MIYWKPFSEKALDFIANSNARLNILHGSVRSSKTINCSVRWLTFLQDGPEGDLAMLGKTAATLGRNVLNDLFDIVGQGNYKWVNRQQGELILLGRRVYCFGANNEDAESKLRGATFAGAYCDEASLYPQSVFQQLMARMSVPGAQAFCNTNPDNPYHWFYTDYIINQTITNKKVWHFTMDDNMSLSKEYIHDLKQMYTGVWYERFILGKWCVAEGAIYDMYDRHKHMIDVQKVMAERPQTFQYKVACDYGTSTVMSWGLYAKYPDGTYYKIKEYYYDAVKSGKQKTDDEFAQEFVEWLEGIRPTVVYCDPSAASWKVALMRRGYNVQNAVNNVINGIRRVSTLLGNNKFFIDHSCTNTSLEYQSYAWDAKAQAKGEDKPIKKNDHTCDTDRYLLYTDSLFGLSGVYGRRDQSAS